MRPLIGVLKGTGIGPEVIEAALLVLQSVEQALGIQTEIRHGGLIGEEAESVCGKSLPEHVVEFCADIFRSGGAILSGPGGGRYVYDLRRRFDLFCKFVPVQPAPELASAGKIHLNNLKDLDILFVRDNSSGVYQGRWQQRVTDKGRLAEHSFSYSEAAVQRLIEVAARAAASRKANLYVIVKEGGVPAVTALWRDIGAAVAQHYRVQARFMNVDFAAYELIQNPWRFDVIAAPNMFGDILADVAALLLSSRGVAFSGNFDAHGHGVYQTNHGCAHDLAGMGVANPGGQILSLAMLLRESFGMFEAATLIEKSLAEVWRQGWRTSDIAEQGCKIVGTRAMAQQVAEQVLCSTEAVTAA